MIKLIDELDNSWKKILLDDKLKETYKKIDEVIKSMDEKELCPPKNMIFNAFKFFKATDAKVVLIGQDPYHSTDKKTGIKHANGLSFSISKGIKTVPPSLKNIFKELGNQRTDGNLEDWAKQGVLLINKVLTVKCSEAKSHSKIGWEKITRHVVIQVAKLNKNCVFILLGKDAQAMQKYIYLGNKAAIILSAGHPSPMNRKSDFIGSGIFTSTNDILSIKDIKSINW